MATTTASCNPDYLYYTTSYNTSTYVALMRYDTVTGTTALVKQFPDNGGVAPLSPDALGVTSDYAYLINQLPAQGAAPTILRINLSTGAQTSHTGTALNAAPYKSGGTGDTFPAGAVSPMTGIYYYGYAVGTGSSWDFYAFDANTDTPIGFVGRINLTPAGSIAYQGDIAFDHDGNLYLTTFNSNVDLLKVAVGVLPTTAQAVSKVLTTTSAGTQPAPSHGLAYMSQQTTKPLWSIQMGYSIYKRTPGLNDAIAGPSINSYVYDLGSCVGPSAPTLSLSKNVESRVSSTDQFKLEVLNGTTVLGTATTTGTATGPQTQNVGPVVVAEGTTYTLKETASGTTSLSSYAMTAACTNNGSPVATSGSNGTFTVTVPTGTTGLVDCVITNGPPKIELKKNVAKRVNSTDQFTLAVKDAAGTTTLGTTATTTGTATGAQVVSAIAPVAPGTTYTLQETASGGANLARYNTSATCSVGGTAVSTTKSANGVFSVTVPAGTTGVVGCEITNTPIPTLALTKNVVGRNNDTDQFTLSIANSGGTTMGTAVTTVGTTNGVQGVKVAPVDVVAGRTYTIKEAAAGGTVLADYTTSATCKAADGTAVTTTGSNGSWTVTIPSGAMELVSCEIKNVAKPTITVTKTLSLGRVAASDQFTVELRTDGATGTVLNTPGDEVIGKGAGHLYGTSLPVGGPGTHSVLTSHTGMSNATLFDNLIDVREGDLMFVDTYGETLAYEVHSIKIILPTEIDDLSVVDGEDLLTLFTCTPYAVNTHRLLVTGHRVPYEPQADTADQSPLQSMFKLEPWMYGLLAGVSLAFVLIVFILVREFRNRGAGAPRRASAELDADRSMSRDEP